MAELQQALCKDLNNEGNFENTVEEMADVEIMLDQMKILYNCEDEIRDMKSAKIGRLENMLKEGEE